MPKVAWISNYRDATGYSKAAIEYMLSMHSVGIDVVSRPIKMTNSRDEVPETIKEFESKDLNGVDAVIQWNLPSEFAKTSNCKCIAGFAYETNKLPNNDWRENIRMMDRIIVPSKFMKYEILAEFIQKTSVVPHSVDSVKFDKQYQKLDFGLPKNCYKFYTISENNKRKNIQSILLAYLSKFSSSDNVALVVKANGLEGTIEQIKDECRRFHTKERYPKIIVVPGYVSDSSISTIHYSCDCFVSASNGEAWCMPAVDAGGFGNPIIVPFSTGFVDYTHPTYDISIKTQRRQVYGAMDSAIGTMTSNETWDMPNVVDISSAMASFAKKPQDKIKEKSDYIKGRYNREVVGKAILDVVNA